MQKESKEKGRVLEPEKHESSGLPIKDGPDLQEESAPTEPS